MGKVYFSQTNFNNYAGARSISLESGVPASYLDELSLDNSNNLYLYEANKFEYVIFTDNLEDNIYMNGNLSGLCRDLTMLQNTDLLNKDIVNYHYVTNMHTAFANCCKLTNKPISAKRVRSMYGTYYNCVKIHGAPKVNANVTNLIGTYYNCTKLSGAPNASNNVISAIGTYYNCINLTGSPVSEISAQSMMEMYYNCYLLEGNPTNCNDAIITSKAYYNCPNIYGDFYWFNDAYKQADITNLVNMFYGRNFQNKLNIYIGPDTCIGNSLINYSSSFGDIYGIGEIEWTPIPNGLTNTYTNTNLYFINNLNQYYISSMNICRNFTISITHDSSSSGGIYAHTFINIFNFQGFIINDQITSGVRVNNTRRISNYYHFINPSNSKIDMTVAVNMQEYYLDIGVDPYSHNICIECVNSNIMFPFANNNYSIIYFIDKNYQINYQQYGPSSGLHRRDYFPNEGIIRPCNRIDAPHVREAFNTYYDLDYLHNRTLRIVEHVIANNIIGGLMWFNYCIENICNCVYTEAGQEIEYNCEIDAICPKYATSMVYAYTGYKIHNLECGNYVTTMDYAFTQCYNITKRGVCGPNVTSMIGTYQYTDINQAVIGNNVERLTEAFAHSLISENYLKFYGEVPINLIWCSGVYNNCQNIWGNLKQYNLIFNILPSDSYGSSLSYFFNCSHIIIPYNIEFNFIEDWYVSYADFMYCNNLIEYPYINIHYINGENSSRYYGFAAYIKECSNLIYIPANIQFSSLDINKCYNLPSLSVNVESSMSIFDCPLLTNVNININGENRNNIPRHSINISLLTGRDRLQFLNINVINNSIVNNFYVNLIGCTNLLDINITNVTNININLYKANNINSVIINNTIIDLSLYQTSYNNYYISI